MFKILVTRSAIPRSVHKGMNTHYNIPPLQKLTRHAVQRFDSMSLSKPSHNLVSAIFLHVLLALCLKKFHLSCSLPVFGIQKHEELAHSTPYALMSGRPCLQAPPSPPDTAFSQLPQNRSKHLLTGPELFTRHITACFLFHMG